MPLRPPGAAVRTAVLAPRVLRSSLGDEWPLAQASRSAGAEHRHNSGAILCPGGKLADEGLGFGSALRRDWMGLPVRADPSAVIQIGRDRLYPGWAQFPPLGAGMSGLRSGWIVSRPGSAGKGDKENPHSPGRDDGRRAKGNQPWRPSPNLMASVNGRASALSFRV